MSPLPDTATPEPSAEDDHARVLEMMGSPQMQQRLEEARAQRERVLAEKAATRGPMAQDPKVRLAWDRELGSIGVVGAVSPAQGEEAPALPWLVEPPEPVPAQATSSAQAAPRSAWLRSRAAGVALGLIAGVALGGGLMRLSAPAPSGAPGESATASDASREGAGEVLTSPAPPALAVVPALAPAADRLPSDLPTLQALSEAPAWGAPTRIVETGTVEGGTVDPASAGPVEVASGSLPALPAPRMDVGLEVAVANLAPVLSGPGPVLAEPPAPEPPPPTQDAPDGPSGSLVGLDWQVALHLPPDTSPGLLQEVQATLRAVGVGLIVGTGASPFGVAQSEVRFFHQDDAADAARIATAMGAQARDFSAYRPAPPRGSFEVWLAADGTGAPPAD